MRQIIGMKPSEDPNADELRNKNLNAPETQMTGEDQITTINDDDPEKQAILDEIEQIDQLVEAGGLTDEEIEEYMAKLDELDDELMGLENQIRKDSS